jgi:dienelactone hydrolase
MSPERPVLLDGADRPLFGVATVPPGRPSGGVLLLAGKAIPAFGNARVWVTAARSLAAAGWLALRLDTAGMGDTAGPAAAVIPGRPPAEDARAGLAWLAEQVDRVVIVGECHGARTGLVAAAQAPVVSDVVGLFPVLFDEDPAAQAPEGDPGFLEAVRRAVDAGVRCHVVYGEGDADLDGFRRARSGPLGDLGGALSLTVAPERLHGIASAAARDAVLELILGKVEAGAP